MEPEPLLAPEPGVESEHWGFEDPRTVWVDELERWMLTCTAYGPSGPAVYLATTTDFRSVDRIGIIRQPEDKNAAILSERVDGKWVLFHRPITTFGGSRGEIVLSRSDDLLELEHARAGDAAPARAPGGTRSGSGSAHLRCAPSTAGW